MTKRKMRVEVQGGINWSWFKVQNGKLVAVFRLHHGEQPLINFRKLQRNMVTVGKGKINVPYATWREKCDLVANHVTHNEGYSSPEVAESFGWLNKLFRDTAGSFEMASCPEGTMRHLEYHGVAICRI